MTDVDTDTPSPLEQRMAFERRQRYDYGERVTLLPANTAATAVAEATEFVDAVESHLRSLGYLKRSA